MPPLEDGEEILHTARKHWFILVGPVVFLCFLGIFPGLFLFVPHVLPAELLAVWNSTIPLEGSYTFSVLFLWTLELLILWIALFLFWTDYYLDVWFVTNQRIIAIEQEGMFNRVVSTFRLDMIQDASVNVPGMLATFFRFGTVSVSTASSGAFKFSGAANPIRLKEKIMEEHHRVQTEKQEVWVKSEQI